MAESLYDLFKKSYDQWKSNIIMGFVYGILVAASGFLGAVSIGILYSLLYPIITAWYYREIGIRSDLKSGIAFISELIPFIFVFIGVVGGIISEIIYYASQTQFYGQFYGAYNNYNNISLIIRSYASEFLPLFIVIGVIGLILYALFIYTIYGSIMGYIDKLNIYPKKSIILFGYYLLVQVLLFAISSIISLIPIVGGPLSLLFAVLFAYPFGSLFVANKFIDLYNEQ